jgi:hypothetical protein
MASDWFAVDYRVTAAVSSIAYAKPVSGVLVAELKGSHSAIKTVANWTGTSERTAKNWLSGRRGPMSNGAA